MERPDFLKSGDIARLIPVISDSRKEQRAVSVLLSVFSAVPNFADAVLSSFGVSVTRRTEVNTFTEIVIKDDKSPSKDRPDGLIIVQRGKKKWSALVEAKIGKALIQQDQIERYLKLAKEHSIDAVISISNEFVARPTHHPFFVQKTLTRKTDWFHVSWTSMLTTAILLHENAQLDDPEQAFLIREFVRFFSDDSAGVEGFAQMPPPWRDAVLTFQSGGILKKSSDDVEAIVSGWHQETRELSLQLSQCLFRTVELKLSKKHLADSNVRIDEDASSLCAEGTLSAYLDIPDAASDMLVVADLKARAIRVSMALAAPQDKKTTKARINWILRQLKKSEPDDVMVRIIWASRTANTDVTLSQLREGISHPEIDASNAVPRAFEIIYSIVQAGRFSGRRTFIEDIEKACPKFYVNIGQHLKRRQPSPPKPITSINTTSSAGAQRVPDTVPLGNDHTALLEVPQFLRRMEEMIKDSASNVSIQGKNKPIRVSRFPSYLVPKAK